jgi:hypothetical protein
LADGQYYKGQWSNDKPSGWGTLNLLSKTGDDYELFEGFFKGGKLHNIGKMSSKMTSYQGEYCQG